jgi:tetratricopeptide (TPR) repeat protein
MWAYVRYVEQPKPTRYLLSLGLYMLGLMSKPMVVTLPFVLLLLDYWPLGRTRWAEPATGAMAKTSLSRLLWEKLPFLALAIATSVVAYWAQKKGGAVSSLEKLPLDVRVPNAFVSYIRYMGKAFWPSRLAAFYPYEIWPLSMVLLAGAALLGVSGAAVWRARREPWLATGWFWYLGTLVPVIGFVQSGGQSMADRYTYIPLIGLFMMVAWAVPCAAPDQRVRKVVTAAAAAALLGACAVLCQLQVRYWKNTETLFRHAVEVTTNNSLAQCNLGVECGRAGRLQEAIAHLEEAVRIKPDYVEAHNSLGRSLMLVGKLNEAIGHLEQALRIKPDLAEAHYNLGGALGQAGRMQEAIGHYEQALRIKPDWAKAHYDLGVALERAGRMQEAIGHYEQALRLKPDLAEAHNNLGAILFQLGKVQEAIRHWEQALRIKPDYAKAHYDLGVALEQAGNVREAIAHYEVAVRLEPDFTNAQSRLAKLRIIP